MSLNLCVTVEQLDEFESELLDLPEEDHYLRLAGEVLADRTKAIVDHWRRGIIAEHPEPRPALSDA